MTGCSLTRDGRDARECNPVVEVVIEDWTCAAHGSLTPSTLISERTFYQSFDQTYTYARTDIRTHVQAHACTHVHLSLIHISEPTRRA